jgi:preprotein translocase subunit SecA
VDRKQGRTEFTRPGMAKLRAAVGWGEVPSPDAVTTAEHVEGAIARSERAAWQRRAVSFDQLIDHYRAELYEFRGRVRDEPDPLSLVGPLVEDSRIEAAIAARRDSLGPAKMAGIIRAVLLQVINLQWREYLIHTEFLRRQSNTLYDPGNMVEARAADATALYAACR